MKKYKEKFRYLDARLKISFVAFCILAFLLVLCLDREWIFSEGFWKIAMIFLIVLLVGFTYLWIWKPYRRLTNQGQRFSDGYISLADLTDAFTPDGILILVDCQLRRSGARVDDKYLHKV